MEASLVKSMAGPSSGKAGLAKDQSEINRIIAEASKDSKFFQEARRKDAQLTEKINKMVKQRDEMVKAADLPRVKASVDLMIVELEKTRDLSRIICHVDLDAFYASVEAIDNPSLVGKAFGVSGGVLTTASYEARKYGCRSGMAAFVARKLCPHLIIVPGHYARYAEMSKAVMSVLEKYDPDIMIVGADEAYLTLNEYCDTHNLTPEECVEQMRVDVFRETKLTCSAGIAPNRLLAKICSDKNKPNGQFALPFDRENIIAFMHDLPLRKVPGIGRVSERVLSEMGVVTCGDVYTHRAMIAVMDKQLGLQSLLNAYLGLASNTVEPPSRESRKSVGVETTFQAIGDKDKLLAKLDKVATELEADMERTGWAGRTVTLKYKLDTFQTFTRAKTLPRYVTSKEDLLAAGVELFMKELPLKLRLIGLRVTVLKDLRPSSGGGIEKFLRKPDQVTATSPSKKRKLSDDASDEEEHISHSQTSHDEFVIDESLLECDDDQDEEDDRIHWVPDPVVLTPDASGQDSTLPTTSHTVRPRSRSPGARPAKRIKTRAQTPEPVSPSTAGPSSPAKLHRKPHSTSSVQSSSRREKMQSCPVCAKELEVDNAGLNEHVDYCLSKGAILHASTSTSNVHAEKGEEIVLSGDGSAVDFGGFGEEGAAARSVVVNSSRTILDPVTEERVGRLGRPPRSRNGNRKSVAKVNGSSGLAAFLRKAPSG